MIRLVYISIAAILMSCSETQEEPNWILIEGGNGVFGDADGRVSETPAIEVDVTSFYLSETEVTNEMFNDFVLATNYVTDAEKSNVGLVFNEAWEIIEGADWRHPLGPNFTIDRIMDHPVVQVSLNDAQAYCEWMGARLPTEIEWEFAARLANSVSATKNIWSGEFPIDNDIEDGYEFTAPVTEYEADELGLKHMSGNVWEWCQDKYNYEVHDILSTTEYHTQEAYLVNYFHPGFTDDSIHVIKGGSFMCHKNYCAGYRPEARETGVKNESYFHVGFRIVKDIE
ncbi:MAG: SUMF1/EgtB/PvdO family nonheme iron enzyme [Crocinitomicaceae bacterium]|nr:SUMF1/EgtB/PvdO family nonheme iron enzyme [Crocinitomicaceae bacterium]